MAEMTRRDLLKKGSLGLAGATAIGMVAGGLPQAAAAAAATPRRRSPMPTGRESSEAVVAYVRDASSGEVGILVGDKEIVTHDAALARRLRDADR
jgi:hypothetical protein